MSSFIKLHDSLSCAKHKRDICRNLRCKTILDFGNIRFFCVPQKEETQERKTWLRLERNSRKKKFFFNDLRVFKHFSLYVSNPWNIDWNKSMRSRPFNNVNWLNQRTSLKYQERALLRIVSVLVIMTMCSLHKCS